MQLMWAGWGFGHRDLPDISNEHLHPGDVTLLSAFDAVWKIAAEGGL